MMATITAEPETSARFRTLADVLDEIGVPAHRILMHPEPGLATVDDVVALRDRERRLVELVNGVLVEKVMGFYESSLACILIQWIRNFLDQNPIGTVAGEGGMMKFAPQLVRIPDVSFIRWEQFPDHKVTRQAVPAIYPDLAVEILSESNTKAEMDRKLQDDFAAGSRLVWYLDPKHRTVRVYTTVDQMTNLGESETLDGGDVLPGFRLSIREWLDRAQGPTPSV